MRMGKIHIKIQGRLKAVGGSARGEKLQDLSISSRTHWKNEKNKIVLPSIHLSPEKKSEGYNETSFIQIENPKGNTQIVRESKNNHDRSLHVFINSQEALVWAKKDFQKQKRCDILSMIRKKQRQKRFSSQRKPSQKNIQKQNKGSPRRNLSYNQRKKSVQSYLKEEDSLKKRKEFLKSMKGLINIRIMQPQKSLKKRYQSLQTQQTKNFQQNHFLKQIKLSGRKNKLTQNDDNFEKRKKKGKKIQTLKDQQDKQFLSPW